MRERLRRLLRRRRAVVLVDEAALRELAALAVLGAAYEVIAAEELRWLALDVASSDHEGETL